MFLDLWKTRDLEWMYALEDVEAEEKGGMPQADGSVPEA